MTQLQDLDPAKLPKPGQLYRHYKGGLYLLLCLGRLSEDRDEVMAVYFSLKKKTVWIRPIEMFLELVPWSDGSMRPRFSLDEPGLPPGTEE